MPLPSDDINGYTTAPTDRRVLNFRPIRAQCIIDQRFLDAATKETVTRQAERDLLSKVAAWLAGETLDVHELSYPKTWWDGFKEQHFPQWARRRWPVAYTRVKWEVRMEFLDQQFHGEHTMVRTYLNNQPHRGADWEERDSQDRREIQDVYTRIMCLARSPRDAEELSRLLNKHARLSRRVR